LLNVNDGGTGGANSRRPLESGSSSESDRPEVGKLDKRATLLIILNNPLSIRLTEASLGTLVAESVRDSLSSGDILNSGSPSSQAGRGDSDLDRVAGFEGDAGEIVRVVGIPFVPGIISNGASRLRPVNAGLQDGSVAGITVDADPSCARAGGSGSWHRKSPGDALVAGANEDGACPIGAVLHKGIV